MKDRPITRRAWAAAFGSVAAVRAQQPPADLDRARQRVQTQLQALRKIAVARDLEPAFKFQA